LEKKLEELGSQTEMPKGFILPGETHQAAAFDLCRSVARRAERRVVELNEQTAIGNPEILCYLNRLSSLLFLLEVKFSKKDDSQNFKYTKAS
jgi:cob(I)alamin adenosyltransferase